MQQKFISLQFSKIIISIALLFGGANIAFAEESGAFFGIGISDGNTTLITDDNNTQSQKYIQIFSVAFLD